MPGLYRAVLPGSVTSTSGLASILRSQRCTERSDRPVAAIRRARVGLVSIVSGSAAHTIAPTSVITVAR
jgi:hypothetical protein